ncbi:hypothetical protein HPB48_018142 [Haemaphysalis longicornis]|uniref:Cullin family profile domain-containing protein n=1 Tax=Haemaphysalis longicornis TaxID=44386 RepID=A0A9J6FTC9_HAELO|nr:hypothetical protein HPB48_018142 [Haemaphysalis longicornis]
MILFKYLGDKDVFQTVFAKLHAKRLVNETYISDYAEKCMISKMKQACSMEYTLRLERLCKDASISKDLNAEFKIYAESIAERVKLDFRAVVMTSASWPFKEKSTCGIPADLQHSAELFFAFYCGKHKDRTLTWFHDVSWGELAMDCTTTTYTLRASMFQMAVLLQFNSELNFTVQQLHESTGIAMDTLLMVLHSLLKFRLLVRVEERSGGTSTQAALRLEPDTLLCVNDQYCNKKVHVNINVPLKAEVQAQQESTNKSALECRRMCIQATIVRIMKARKSLKHEELVAEVLSQLSLRFQPDVLMIKAGIDVLLDKEYIERAQEEPDVYNYVALNSVPNHLTAKFLL